MLNLLKWVALIVAAAGYVSNSYYTLLVAFSVYLLLTGIVSSKFNVKLFAFFFLAYLIIPFLNISEYRGSVGINTLALYCILQILVILLISGVEKTKLSEVKFKLISTKTTRYFFYGHLLIIYASVLYVYATIGMVILNQEIRFNIPPTIEYVIKSGLSLPLLWAYIANLKLNLRSALLYFLAPIVPSLLIGSRGTFIMIIISLFVSLFMFKRHNESLYILKYNRIYKKLPKFLMAGGVLAIVALYTGFYIRRDGVELITAVEVLDQYNFAYGGFAVLAILPIYLGLREQIGITNRIIEEGIKNSTDLPLFVSELITILPGHQVAPGILLARDVYMAQGSDEKYSLTPGIVGGLYMDFGLYLIPIVLALVYLILALYNKSIKDVRYGLFYSLTIVQFFHLYHRGFLKIEYFVPYFVLLIFMLTLARKKY